MKYFNSVNVSILCKPNRPGYCPTLKVSHALVCLVYLGCMHGLILLLNLNEISNVTSLFRNLLLHVKDCQQVIFPTLKRFCPSSKKNPTPLFLTENIKIDRIPTKIRCMPFLHCISSFEGTSYKICKTQPPDLLFLVVFISFYISR